MEIVVESVCKDYCIKKNGCIQVLRNVFLSIKQGEFVCIKGVSGSGKSTLLHLLGGLDRPTKGSIRYGSDFLTRMSDASLARFRNKHIGFVFQDYALVPYRTVEDNMFFPLYFSSIPRKDFKNRLERQLTALKLTDLRNRRVDTLSGGQRQRVAIARSLLLDPDVILADEPTGALDSKTSKETVELLKKINEQGKTVIIVTHDESIAESCSRVINIVDGEVIE